MCKERAVGSYENVQGGWWVAVFASKLWTVDTRQRWHSLPFSTPPHPLPDTVWHLSFSWGNKGRECNPTLMRRRSETSSQNWDMQNWEVGSRKSYPNTQQCIYIKEVLSHPKICHSNHSNLRIRLIKYLIWSLIPNVFVLKRIILDTKICSFFKTQPQDKYLTYIFNVIYMSLSFHCFCTGTVKHLKLRASRVIIHFYTSFLPGQFYPFSPPLWFLQKATHTLSQSVSQSTIQSVMSFEIS